MPVAVIFETEHRDGLKDPSILAAIRDFQAWLEAQPEVDRSLSLVDFIEEMHWGFNAEDPAFRRLPNDEALISQYLLIYDKHLFGWDGYYHDPIFLYNKCFPRYRKYFQPGCHQ